MPKLSKPLADLAVRNAKPYPDGRARKLAGGGGLYLYVPASGSKLWRWDYRIGGKQKTVSLGSYPDLSLAKARELRDAQKARLTDGTDPAAATQARGQGQGRPRGCQGRYGGRAGQRVVHPPQVHAGAGDCARDGPDDFPLDSAGARGPAGGGRDGAAACH